MRSLIVVLVAVLVMSLLGKDDRGGFGGFSVGSIYIDNSEINDLIGNYGFDKFDDNFATFGGGGFGRVGSHFLIGGSGFGIPETSVENDSITATLSGGGGFFEMGYIVYQKKGYSFAPILGIGGSGLSISLKPKREDGVTFEDLLLNPKRGVDLDTGNLSMKFSLMNMFMFNASEKDGEIFNIGASLQIGTIYHLSDDGWSADMAEISGGPERDKLNYFLELSIYFGSSKI